jgi:hypothetical protein
MSDTNVARLTIGDISVVSGERGIHCSTPLAAPIE